MDILGLDNFFFEKLIFNIKYDRWKLAFLNKPYLGAKIYNNE